MQKIANHGCLILRETKEIRKKSKIYFNKKTIAAIIYLNLLSRPFPNFLRFQIGPKSMGEHHLFDEKGPILIMETHFSWQMIKSSSDFDNFRFIDLRSKSWWLIFIAFTP